jgi:hypothetical protein
VDHSFREDRPILTGQAPSLQLVGSGEATSLGIAGYERVQTGITAGKVFIPLLSRVSLILEIELLRSFSS